jgi:hypothetical protein
MWDSLGITIYPMLILHQECQTHESITCGGVITVLANALVINLGNLQPLNVNKRVSLSVVRSASMITTRDGRTFIHILEFGHLMPTSMPHVCSIEDNLFHYDVQGED